MSEELLQRGLDKNPEKIGKWDFYSIGATTIKALKEYGILHNIDYGASERKKVDALIVSHKNVIAVIEYKKPSEFKTKAQKEKAIEQEIEVAQKLKAKVFIATDTKESVWVNTLTGNKIKDENGNEIKILFDHKDEKVAALIKKICDSINVKNDSIKPKQLINPTDLAKSIWQDIWSVSGATPENCLYTFVELFIFKYLSDLEVLRHPQNFDALINLYDERNGEYVLEYYADNVRPEIKKLFPENNLDKTTIINGTIFVSKDQRAVKGYSTTFKNVLDKFSRYGKLEHIDYNFKSQIFESFLKESISKKNWGQFFTPLKVVRSIIEMAKDEIQEGVKICDPACGVGKFLLESLVSRLEEFYKINEKDITSKISIYGFDKGFDKDEQKTIILAKANMLIYFSDLIKDNPRLTKKFSDLFNKSFTLKTNSILGTLSEPIENEYDLILTNPPYVTSGSSNLKDEIKKDGDLEKYYKINAMGVEGLFMEWIVRALKPTKKAFVVIPDGILNRQNDKNLRQFILDECYIDGLISLPEKTFFTTPKKTYILAITKKTNKQDIQKEPVFTYLVSEIGESRDIYRFDIEQNDLENAVLLFNQFKGAKKHFKTDEPRCKIQPIEKFDSNLHWSVDRWWTKEEQIKLGILEKDQTVSIAEFKEFVGEMAESFNEFSQILKEFDEKKNSKKTYKVISLANKKYFELFIGKRLVKKDLVKLKGSIPIYSANIFNPVGHHIKSNIDNFNNNFVIWGIDGDFEFNFIKKNTPFVTTDHCGTIRIMAEDIFPEYLMLQLLKIKHNYRFDRGLRSSLKNMNQISVEIPFDSKGNIDIQIQKDVLEKYQIVKETKKKIQDYKKKNDALNVEIKEQNQSNKTIKIEDIFDLSIKTNSSKFTKNFIHKHKGKIPVYSASKFPETVDYGYVKDHLKNILYFENCLTWNIDGSVGKVYFRKGKFSLSEKVIPLIVKKNLQTRLDLEFLRNIIENEFAKYSFGFANKAGKGKIRSIKIPIPIDKNGEFDLQAQKEIAEKYKQVENIKTSICTELDKIDKMEVSFL